MIQKIVRGQTLFIVIVFYDQNNAPILSGLSEAELRVAYTVDGEPATDQIELQSDDAGNWSGTFDTSPCDKGTLSWFAHSGGSPSAACQGFLIVDANRANPQGSS